MAATEKTLDRLHSLETLYRKGYQSDRLDQSLEKIVSLELNEAQRECAKLGRACKDLNRSISALLRNFTGNFTPAILKIARI